jgi:putative addiction module CopG family antidote
MHVSLHPALQRFVEDEVKAGHYESPEAVINAAVARLQTEEELSSDELADLKAEIAIAIEEADRGEVEEWNPEDFKRRVRAHLNAQGQAG